MREERRLSDRLLQVIDLGEKAVVHVLSGGGALALMHIGVLVAIREAGIPVHAVVGNSAGAIGTVIYSEAQSYNAILHAVIIGISVRWRDLARIGNPTAGGTWWRFKIEVCPRARPGVGERDTPGLRLSLAHNAFHASTQN